MLNQIVIMGRMTRDPEQHSTASGISCVSFTLAVDRDYKPEGGEREADFIDVVAWRHTADFVSKYFGKGRMAVVAGRLQTRSYTDKEGNKRKAVSVVAENVYFGDSKKEDSGSGSYGAPYTGTDSGYQRNTAPSNVAPPPAPDNGYFEPLGDNSGDLPF